MKLGAKLTPPHILARVPYLHAHLDEAAVPLMPDRTFYSSGMSGQWGDLGNIQYGNCIYAGFGHYMQCASSNAVGTPVEVTTEQVLGWYTDVEGFDRNDPSTDTGSTAVSALNYFMRKKMIAGYARIDLTDPVRIARGLNLFGGLYTIVVMPEAWQGSSIWGSGPDYQGAWEPNSWGSHCVFTPDNDPSMNLTAISWGTPYIVTPGGCDNYMVEGYVIISNYWVNRAGRTLQGFDLAGLQRALTLVM
jgi:hypothetical protein